MPARRLDHRLPLLLPRAKRIKSKDYRTQASTANVDLRMIYNLEHHGSQGYLVSGHIEVKLLVIHGIEATSLDACVGLGHAHSVTVQGKLDVRIWGKTERNYIKQDMWSSLHYPSFRISSKTVISLKLNFRIVPLTVLSNF